MLQPDLEYQCKFLYFSLFKWTFTIQNLLTCNYMYFIFFNFRKQFILNKKNTDKYYVSI